MSASSWLDVRAKMDLDEDRVAAYRERWLAEIKEFQRADENDEQQD